jgi:hypothetical protein
MLPLDHEFTEMGKLYAFSFNQIKWINWLYCKNEVFVEEIAFMKIKEFIDSNIKELCTHGDFIKATGFRILINRDYGDQKPADSVIDEQIQIMLKEYKVGCIFKPDSSKTLGFLITKALLIENKVYLLKG